METQNLNDIRFTKDGQAFFLHHSTNPNIQAGESIKASTGIKQVTAADALGGFSYGWDPYGMGIKNAVLNQARAPYVYLTSAPVESVYPDLNIPGSSARAIEGEQRVLDKVDLTDLLEDTGVESSFMDEGNEMLPNLEKSESRILDMFRKHELPIPSADKGVAEALNVGVSVSDKGVTMMSKQYQESVNALVSRLDDLFSRGNVPKAYLEGGPAHGQMKAWQQGGREALTSLVDEVSGESIRAHPGFKAYAKLSETHTEVLGRDLTQMTAQMTEGRLSKLALRDSSEVAQAVTKGSRGSRSLRSIGLRRLLR